MYSNFESDDNAGFTQNPQSIPKKPANEVSKSTIFPMTCLCLNGLQTDNKKNYIFRDIPIFNPVVCGRVVEIKEENDVKKYVIDDSTGYFTAGCYLNGDDEDVPQIEVNDYIKVVGKMKIFARDRFILATKVTKVDVNHMLAHLIECAYAVKAFKE